jgi:peroxiredoxin
LRQTTRNAAAAALIAARFAGRVVMLAYFATWCSTCNASMPLFETELWQAYVDAGGLVLGLANQQPEQVVAWARANGLSFPILLQQDSYERWADPDPAGPYALDVVLDRQGIARGLAHGGAIEHWIALFESLL